MSEDKLPDWVIEAKSLGWPDDKLILLIEAEKQLGSTVMFVHRDVIVSETGVARFKAVRDHGTANGMYLANTAAAEYASQDFELLALDDEPQWLDTDDEWLDF